MSQEPLSPRQVRKEATAPLASRSKDFLSGSLVPPMETCSKESVNHGRPLPAGAWTARGKGFVLFAQ